MSKQPGLDWSGYADGLPPKEPRDATGISREASESMIPTAGSLRFQVLSYIRGRGLHGATDNEIEHALGLRHQTASARRRELVLTEFVVDSGRRRLTDSRRRAIVWVAVKR
jgi:hypothetical protein